MRPPVHRRRFFLPGSCQGRFLALNVAHQGLVFAIVAGAIFFPLMAILRAAPPESAEAQTVATEFLALHERIWPAFPLALVLVGLHSLLFSHRIAGPLYRFSKVFEAVSSGDLTVPVRIRKHDYLQGEAARLGGMLDALRAKIALIDESADHIQSVVDRLQSALKTGSIQEAQQLVSVLAGHHQELREAMFQFQTHPARAFAGR